MKVKEAIQKAQDLFGPDAFAQMILRGPCTIGVLNTVLFSAETFERCFELYEVNEQFKLKLVECNEVVSHFGAKIEHSDNIWTVRSLTGEKVVSAATFDLCLVFLEQREQLRAADAKKKAEIAAFKTSILAKARKVLGSKAFIRKSKGLWELGVADERGPDVRAKGQSISDVFRNLQVREAAELRASKARRYPVKGVTTEPIVPVAEFTPEMAAVTAAVVEAAPAIVAQ